MKRPKWLSGQGGPAPDESEGDPEALRAERARRERVRAQRRLAAKASGSGLAGESKEPHEEPEVEETAAGKRATKSKSKPAKERRARQKGLPALRKEGAGLGSALKQGVKATRSTTKGVPARIGRAVVKGVGPVFAIFFDVVGFVLSVLIAGVLVVAKPVRATISGLARLVRLASVVITPIRILTLVVAGAAVLLALSQFADYRSISIGTDAYAEVETVAPAPVKERDETGSAHAYVMVPLAAASLVLLGLAVSGRRRLCRLIAVAGGIAIAVSLLVDRPAGLDPGDLELAFDGVRAQLLGGFYAQLFSGLLLTASALLLGRELRLAGAAKPARSEPRRSRRRSLRRSPKAEGARA